MKKSILIVYDYDMKRLDTTTEFNYRLIKQAADEGIAVEYVLPTEPCAQVIKRMSSIDFRYRVLDYWWKKGGSHRRSNIRIVRDLFSQVLLRKPDLIVFKFCYESTAILLAILLRIFMKNPPALVWHQHSEIKRAEGWVKRRFSKIKIVSYFVVSICSVFKGQEAILAERGIPPNKFFSIYNGIELARFDESFDIRSIKAELNIDEHDPVVMTVANLIPMKGVEYLLRAIPLVKETAPRVRVLVVGAGPDMERLKNLAQQMKIDDNMMFLGTRNDVHRLLAVADLFVLPTLAEAFGIVNIEAMAARKPVVATNVGGIPEVVMHNESGILVEPRDSEALADAIRKLLIDKDLARKMGTRGRNIVESNFTLGSMVDNYLGLYASFING